MGKLNEVVKKAFRRKPLTKLAFDFDTQLKRCLNIFDLVFLSIGAQIGAGIYLLVGIAAKKLTGPSVVVAMISCAFALIPTAFVYCEFSGLIPQTGSSYTYAYVGSGELMAFLFGWERIVGTIIGGGLSARAWGSYLNYLLDGKIENITKTYIVDWSDVGAPICDYPSFAAALLLLILGAISTCGIQFSSKFNTVFAGLSVLILTFVSIMGFTFGDIENWNIKPGNVTTDESIGNGGFFPFGIHGTLAGIAAAIWAYGGYEVPTYSSEEAKHPKRDVPVSMLLSLFLVAILYSCTVAAMTLLCPYYLLDDDAPLSSAFKHADLKWAEMIVTLGPLCGMLTVLQMPLLTTTRIIFKMSEDHLLPKIFSIVNNRTKVPYISILFTTAGQIMVCLFLDVASIFAYQSVQVLFYNVILTNAIVIIRYQSSQTKQDDVDVELKLLATNDEEDTSTQMIKFDINFSKASYKKNYHWLNKFLPKPLEGSIKSSMLLSTCLLIVICAMINFQEFSMGNSIVIGVLLLLELMVTSFIFTHKQNVEKEMYEKKFLRIPFVPWFPILGIFINIFFIFAIRDFIAWVGMITMNAFGLTVYFLYSWNRKKE